MTLLILNLLLAVIWILLWGTVDFYTILVGLVGGYFVLWVFTRALGKHTVREAYGQHVLDLISFGWYFLIQLVKSNLMLAREVLTPGLTMRPRIIRYDIGSLNDAQIVALSNAITLTPGTLVVDVSKDKKQLYIHAMFAQDRDKTIADLDELRHRMERQVFRLPHHRPSDKAPPRNASGMP
jgi:multicomponent Na+:H+ antiporter subunit E